MFGPDLSVAKDNAKYKQAFGQRPKKKKTKTTRYVTHFLEKEGQQAQGSCLLQLCFAKHHVLAQAGIIFLDLQLFCGVLGVAAAHIERTGALGAEKLDVKRNVLFLGHTKPLGAFKTTYLS